MIFKNSQLMQKKYLSSKFRPQLYYNNRLNITSSFFSILKILYKSGSLSTLCRRIFLFHQYLWIKNLFFFFSRILYMARCKIYTDPREPVRRKHSSGISATRCWLHLQTKKLKKSYSFIWLFPFLFCPIKIYILVSN